ncbi:hypothetical protein DUHN55_25010 [Helicobacter pylori]
MREWSQVTCTEVPLTEVVEQVEHVAATALPLRRSVTGWPAGAVSVRPPAVTVSFPPLVPVDSRSRSSSSPRGRC